MNEIFSGETWLAALANIRADITGAWIATYPKLLAALGTMVAGWLFSKLVEAITRRILRRVGVDKLVAVSGATSPSDSATFKRLPSSVLARTLFWIIITTFGLFAVRVLEIKALDSIVGRLIAYVPDVIAAVAIVAVGMFTGRLVKNLIGSAAAATELIYVSRLGSIANALVIIAFSILAIEQLGIRTELIVIFAATVIVAVGITMGIAFALGAKPVITHILAGHYLRQILKRGRIVVVQGRRGEVEQVGAVHTVFRDEDSAWSVANARLLEDTITL